MTIIRRKCSGIRTEIRTKAIPSISKPDSILNEHRLVTYVYYVPFSVDDLFPLEALSIFLPLLMTAMYFFFANKQSPKFVTVLYLEFKKLEQPAILIFVA